MTRCIKLIGEDLASKLNNKAGAFILYSSSLDQNNDIKDTAQLLTFIRGINGNFAIREEFLALESVKGKMWREDLYDSDLDYQI